MVKTRQNFELIHFGLILAKMWVKLHSKRKLTNFKSKVFKNHYQAMAFVNAVAWVSHTENHHPSITVGYKDVHIEYWTHDINGISENDFICAAKVNEL